MSAVEQLEHGVRVCCADGTEIVCAPLTLKTAKQILPLFNKRFAPKPPVSTPPTDAEAAALAKHFLSIAETRIEIVRLFGDLYPDLEAHISPGDVESLLYDFFWHATGAIVPGPAEEEILPGPPTGTPPSATTAPSGVSSPTS